MYMIEPPFAFFTPFATITLRPLPHFTVSLHNHNVCSAYSIASVVVIPFGSKAKEKKMKYNTENEKAKRLGWFQISAPADCRYG